MNKYLYTKTKAGEINALLESCGRVAKKSNEAILYGGLHRFLAGIVWEVWPHPMETVVRSMGNCAQCSNTFRAIGSRHAYDGVVTFRA